MSDRTYRLAVLAGDGIGPEVMPPARAALERLGAKHGFACAFEEALVGGAAIDACGEALPPATVAVCERADAILFGSVGGPRWEHLPPARQPERASLLPLRRHFRLFANLRPGVLYPELIPASPLKAERIPHGIDVLCVRELTGGLYFGQPKATRTLDDGDIEAVDTMVYRKSEIVRVLEVAAGAARTRARRLCSVDKANVLENSVLWRKTVTEWMADHAPDVQLSHLYVDNAAMQLVRSPGQFDVIVTENLFGDVLTDELAAVCGSLGMLASASLGAGRNRFGHPYGLYEPAGGTAPDIAGKGLANPCAQLLSAALLLRFSFGEEAAARELEAAVKGAVTTDGVRTGDIAFGGPAVGTAALANAVLARL